MVGCSINKTVITIGNGSNLYILIRVSEEKRYIDNCGKDELRMGDITE